MRTTFAGLNTAVRGLSAQQAGLDTMGHNIANVNTKGYSRQNTNLVTMQSQTIGGYSGNVQIGSGTAVSSITRARDQFIDRQYWKENSHGQYSSTVLSGLSNVEQVFQEPTETGIQSVMNKFWQSWQSLSVNAADYGCRTNVKSCGINIADSITQAATQLKNRIADTNSVINLNVKSINEITSEIASLNGQIFKTESNGDHANDLRDRRDLLVNNLSDLVNVNVTEMANGSYTISIDGNHLVNDTTSKNLVTKISKDADYGYETNKIYMEGINIALDITGGKVGGLLQSRDNETFGYKGYLNQLSTISQYFLTDFNEVHRKGLGTDDSTNNNFFGSLKNADGTDYDYKNDPSGLTSKYTKGDWLNALEVNPVLTTVDGLEKIAAKTGKDSDIYAKVTAPKVTTTGIYTGTDAYKGITIVKSTDAATGAVSYKAQSADGSKSWPATVTSDKVSFTINGLTVTSELNGGSFDAYKYDIASNGAVSATDTAGNDFKDSMVTVTTSGTYTAGNATTKLVIEKKADGKYYYSLDGAEAKEATVVGGKITFPDVKGLTLTVDVNKAAAVGTYTIPISKSNNASGDNAVNLANFMKNGAVSLLGNTSLETFYASVIADLGVQTQNMERLSENQDTLVSQVVNWREQVSGVNIDEEMTDMIRFQRGYNAASRVINTMDEMLDKLINSTGVVGR